MDLLIIFFVFIFGSIVGSFLNVVILRYNTGRSIVTGRSSCFSCSQKLSWYNMLPIISFLVQKGRCTSCFSKISCQYIVVELLTAVSSVLLYIKFGFSFDLLFYSLVFCILIVISVYDFRHKIIPNSFAYLLVALTFFRLVYIHILISPEVARSSFMAGMVMFLFLGSLWLFSGGKWMGLGDAKLILGLGWLNTLCYSITSLVYSFWLGAVVGILINLLFKKVKEIPFAPFLIAGFVMVFFSGSNLFYYFGDLSCIK